LIHEKNDFVEVFKNLAKYRFENNLVDLSTEHSSNTAATLQRSCNISTKLFSDLYLAKFLDTLAK